jgi:3-hydroxybutyryl-CoA dehydrogenase
MKLEEIKTIGVCGAGTMGFGIAINFALAGYPTIIYDLDEQILERSINNIRSALHLFAAEKLITRHKAETAFKRITATTDLSELAARSDFISEAIIERSEDKRKLFNKLDRLCPDHTIIVSNTSYLVLSDFGSDVRRQDKIGLTHYFAPAHIVPGVEVAKGPGTSDETYNLLIDLMQRIGKIPIRVLKERPGYLLNTIQAAMSREANRLWAEGVASAEDIELGIKSTFGFRMPHEGPMLHYDVSGVWRWPNEVRAAMPSEQAGGDSGMEPAVAEKIRQRMEQGKPWFVDPEKFDEAIELRDREYIHRLKDLYRPKSRNQK